MSLDQQALQELFKLQRKIRIAQLGECETLDFQLQVSFRLEPKKKPALVQDFFLNINLIPLVLPSSFLPFTLNRSLELKQSMLLQRSLMIHRLTLL
jgi:hypothetical protein